MIKIRKNRNSRQLFIEENALINNNTKIENIEVVKMPCKESLSLKLYIDLKGIDLLTQNTARNYKIKLNNRACSRDSYYNKKKDRHHRKTHFQYKWHDLKFSIKKNSYQLYVGTYLLFTPFNLWATNLAHFIQIEIERLKLKGYLFYLQFICGRTLY